MKDLNDFPIVCQVDGERIFSLNFTNEFVVERQINKEILREEFYHDFALGIGLKGYQRTILPSFAHKLMSSLPKNKEVVSSKEVGQSIDFAMRYFEDKLYTTGCNEF